MTARKAGPPLTLDLGPAILYAVRRLARHVEALDVGGALAVDVGARRVMIQRRAAGWTVDGSEVPTLPAVLAELQGAAAAWLVDGEAA